jgi:hypothetical protein
MPIRINLLAEAQANEEQRRKDPVKRAVLAGVVLVFIVGMWATTLQLKVMAAKRELTSLDTRWRGIESGYKTAVDSQRATKETDERLDALQTMTTNRFLWGNALNAMQQTLNGVDDVTVLHLKADQTYTFNEGVGARTNGSSVVSGKAATATERIIFTIDGVDTSGTDGKRIGKFKDTITGLPYFTEYLTRTNGVLLTSRNLQPSGRPGNSPNVNFTLQCYFQEKTR